MSEGGIAGGHPVSLPRINASAGGHRQMNNSFMIGGDKNVGKDPMIIR